MGAKTPAEIDALATYTNAQLLKLCRYATATLLSDPSASVTVAGRTYTHQNLDALQRMEKHYQDLAAQDAEAAGAGSLDDDFAAPVVHFQEAI
jgi:hypothetical protein